MQFPALPDFTISSSFDMRFISALPVVLNCVRDTLWCSSHGSVQRKDPLVNENEFRNTHIFTQNTNFCPFARQKIFLHLFHILWISLQFHAFRMHVLAPDPIIMLQIFNSPSLACIQVQNQGVLAYFVSTCVALFYQLSYSVQNGQNAMIL